MKRVLDATIIVPTLGRVGMSIELASRLAALDPKPKKTIFVFQDQEELRLWKNGAQNSAADGIFCSERGASHARNLGAKHAKTTYLVFLDDDCFPQNADWLQRLVTSLGHNNVCLSTGPVVGWESASSFFRNSKRAFMLGTPLLIPWGNPESTYSGFCMTVAGGNFAVTREYFSKMRGFSESFGSPSIYEETELSIRFAAGRQNQIWFESSAPVCHKQSQTGGMRTTMARPSEHHLLQQRALLYGAVSRSRAEARFRLLAFRIIRATYIHARSGWAQLARRP